MVEFTKPPLEAYKRLSMRASILRMDDEDLEFIKEQSGIEDPEALKKHIIAVQNKAYDVRLYGHVCIRRFSFTRPKISTFPMYEHVLDLGRKAGSFLILGVAVLGTDIRKCASDGVPVQNLIASDLRPVFWDLGHELFKTTPKTFRVTFLSGDALDPNFLQPSTPLPSSSSSLPHPRLRNSIHVSSLFHLFFEPQQLRLARSLAGLSPAPGSVILGSHAERRRRVVARDVGGGFPAGTIEVKAELRRRRDGEEVFGLIWCGLL
ncbi:methyltransferase ausD [Favolaschia claudopus]|uniref:Methyltransferase ausD n=1 Tax=Favolaschia claudopus TaxID=2862362 RepID=A0AAW0CTD6_9AGAR